MEAVMLHRFYTGSTQVLLLHEGLVVNNGSSSVPGDLEDWTGCFIVDARYHWQSPVVCEPFKYKYNENKWFV